MESNDQQPATCLNQEALTRDTSKESGNVLRLKSLVACGPKCRPRICYCRPHVNQPQFIGCSGVPLQKTRDSPLNPDAIPAATGSLPLSKWLFEFGGNSCKTACCPTRQGVALPSGTAPMLHRLFSRAGVSLSGQRPT